MYSQQQALEELARYQPSDAVEQEAQEFIRKFIIDQPAFWSRNTLAGHLTGSAWVVNEARTKAVLLHHKKLNIWVQPGGHMEDSDATMLAASLREATEETGLTDLQLGQESIFDLDIHKIPARKDEPEHWHLDVRYLFVTQQEELTLCEDSNDLAWFDRAQIEQLTDEESVLRMVRKSL